MASASVRELHTAVVSTSRGWRGRAGGYETLQAAVAAFVAHGEAVRLRLQFETGVAYAYCGGAQTGANNGGLHITVKTELRSGRMVRAFGDALCKPARKFWDLSTRDGERADCLRCLEIAERLVARASGGV